MGQVLCSIIRSIFGRPDEQYRLISPPRSDSCSHPGTEGAVIDSHIQVVESDSLVSPPFPYLITRDLRKEYQAKEEDNEEEKRFISKEVVMDVRWMQLYNSSHSIQGIEDKKKVSLPFPDFNTREPIREEDSEEEKVIMCKEVVMEVRWIQHYSSSHKMLLVGEGDFSFSASLAVAFGSASNMIATSLDSRGFLHKNYKNAGSNILKLRSRGCMVMHEVDATGMANHCLLKGMKFDRIIFNFPHTGFFGRNEPTESQLCRHQTLILKFLKNAEKMISEEGEIHITHKSRGFFLQWNLEHLARVVGLQKIEELHFNFRDYAGYRTKYGFGGDKNFNCRHSKTYKFGLKSWEKDF